MIFATGGFRGVACLAITPTSLVDRRSMPGSFSKSIFSSSRHYRLVQVVDPLNLSAKRLAFGQYDTPFSVIVCDVVDAPGAATHDSKEPACELQVASVLRGHESEVMGVECVASASSSRLNVLSGGNGDELLLLHDSKTEKLVCSLPDSPKYVKRILCVPEWNRRAFVGGSSSNAPPQLFGYDLVKGEKLGSYLGHIRNGVDYSCSVHGLSADVSQNLLLSGADDRTAKMWSWRDFTCEATLHLPAKARSLYYVPEKCALLVGLKGPEALEVWDLRQTRKRLKSFSVSDVSRSSLHDIDQVDDQHFVSCTERGVIAVWNPFRSVSHIRRVNMGRFAYGVRRLRDPATIGFLAFLAEEEEERIAYLLGRECLLAVGAGNIGVHSLFRCFFDVNLS